MMPSVPAVERPPSDRAVIDSTSSRVIPKLYKIGTCTYFFRGSALRSRVRTGHTGVSVIQLVVVSCHNVWVMMILQ